MTDDAGQRVTTLELFFDLVFVFTITQLTLVLADDLTPAGLGRVALLFTIMWWMYGGYAWLTNGMPPNTPTRRAMLTTGMGGFLVIALAIPHAYAGDAWAFGLGYFVVNLVHSGLFLATSGATTRRSALGLAPLNLASATMVLIGSLIGGTGQLILWGIVVVVQAGTPFLHRVGGFAPRAGHFVERHGLVVIVALGESIVAIGVGARDLPVTFGLIAVAVLSLIIAYYLWWTYFGADDVLAEHALAAIEDPTRRARAGLNAFGFAHIPMLIGIIMVSAGIKKTIGHPAEHLGWGAAGVLGGGVALFLAGDVLFRRVLDLGSSGYRMIAGAAAAATIPLGALVSGAVQLATLAGALVVLLSVEGIRGIRAGTVPRYLGDRS